MQNIQGWYLFFLNWELCGFHIYSCPVAYLLIPATQNAVDVFFRKHHDGTQFSTGSFIETVNTWIISEAKTAAGLEQVKTGEMMFLLGDSVPAVVEVRAPSKIYHFGPTLKKKKRSPATFFFSSEECLNHLICSKGSWTSHLIPNFPRCRRHEIYRIKKINTSSQNSHLSNSKLKFHY